MRYRGVLCTGAKNPMINSLKCNLDVKYTDVKNMHHICRLNRWYQMVSIDLSAYVHTQTEIELHFARARAVTVLRSKVYLYRKL